MDLFNHRKIGIFGGSFDPIHYGHLAAAEAVFHAFSLDKVVFMPSYCPPHKLTASSDHDRLAMTRLAAEQNHNFAVSDLEIKEQISFTSDTVKRILSESNSEIYFILGGDQILQVPGWKDANALLSLCGFICVTRPGFQPDVEPVRSLFKKGLFTLEIPGVNVSSSEIRKNVRSNAPVKYLLSDSVIDYITQKGLYKPKVLKYCKASFEEIEERLKASLNEKRYIHTKSVAHEALKLARQFDEDEEKAYLAGLLHDIAKGMTVSESLEYCEKYGIYMDVYTRNNPEIWHGFIGEDIARQEFGVNDADILNAIKWHTTGREKMSVLEKIVYIADIIESTREPNAAIDEIRLAASKSLELAFAKTLKYKFDYLNVTGREPHPESLKIMKVLGERYEKI